MNKISNTSLFSNLSPQAASQTNGGHWVHSHWHNCGYSTTTVRIRYYPVSGRPGNTINITNSEIDDTLIDVF